MNMNTWFVGNHPVGHYASAFPFPRLAKIPQNSLVPTAPEGVEQQEYGKKVFFMKGRIMAGQADISKNEFGDQEFQWLAKEEVEERVGVKYWSDVRNMLSER